MNQSFYTFYPSANALRFDFASVGRKIVSKTIIYNKTGIENFYSLALFDVRNDGSLDDMSVTNNGDMEKILLTVFKTFSVFFAHYPDQVVIFSGSTQSRTRLYKIAISHELSSITDIYNVYGFKENSFELFQKNQPYTGFLVSLKSVNIA